MYKLINPSKLLVNAIALTVVFVGSLVNSQAQNITLQILHASDFEAGLSASSDAPNFAAVVDALDNTYANTLILSSGDNFIPSPFSFSGEDATMVNPLKNAYIAYYGSTFANNDLRAGIARPDISILNFIGVEAAALGNHEFDLGTSELKNIIAGANSGSSIRWFGANFPYLSSNLTFTNDPNLSAYYQSTPVLNTTFMSNPSETAATIAAKKKLAPSTIIEKNGQRYGIVGVTTPILEAISSPGFTTVNNPGAGTENMALLASILQPVINELINNQNCNKIILLAHLQQLTLEKQLATYLNGVDIIIAGGSHTLMADSQDRLRTGDTAVETYPYFTTGADGGNIAIINTAAEYKYLGRLVIDFDSTGAIIPSSVDPLVSGAYATDDEGVLDYYPTLTDAFAAGTKGGLVKGLADGIAGVITLKDGNTFGKADVYLQGLRNYVRTQETNLGDITADANLWQAKQYNPEVKVSLKNGGGIRSSMGVIYAVGDSVVYLPTAANPAVGKEEGEISQLDIENCLRFNNQLSVLDVTATGMKAILEHSVAASGPGQTQGRFPQISGMQFSFNLNNAAQSRIINAAILDDNGNVSDTIVYNGSVYGNPNRVIKMVTLNFLATGGDSYPFVALGSNRVDLVNVLSTPGSATFALPGSEQDAFAEFMSTFYNTNAFSIAETPVSSDFRIQDVNARQDLVLVNEEIAVTGNNVAIANGDLTASADDFTNFGGAIIGSPVTKTFVISNSGSVELTVSSVNFAGANANLFSTATTLPLTIAANSSANLNVTFAPSASGVFAASIAINNTDYNEGAYTFALAGTGLLAGVTGPNSSASPYLLPVQPGVQFTSLISAGDTVGNYRMVGIPDGLGAFDNNNGTFTVVMTHELNNTQGIARAHGGNGAFVSKWIINKSDLSVVSGSDLIQTVNVWNTSTSAYELGANVIFNRFCSADMAATTAFFNSATGNGTQERLFLTGEESGAEGRAFANIVTGANAGVTYQLPRMGRLSFENAVANPNPSDKTIVVGTDDTTPGQVYVYVGTKGSAGTEIEKAGLTNGNLYGVVVAGLPTETSASVIADGTAFSLHNFGNVENTSGADLQTASVAASVTNFLRPEDGAWDPSNPSDFYFVTTNNITSPSRMYKLHFSDINNPQNGGTITAVLNGTEGQKMMDNIGFDNFGNVLVQEDPGNNAYLAQVYNYNTNTDELKAIGQHNPSLFTSGLPNFITQDEESSGVLDLQNILGAGYFILTDQIHFAVGGEIVEKGQMTVMYNPETFTNFCASLDTTEVVYACQSYTWNGTTYTNSGTYTHAATSPEGCTYTETLVLTIQTNAPSIPTVVTGAIYACDYLTSGTTTYSTPAVAGTTYEWVAPTGMTIVSGQGTNSITVSFESAFVTSNLKVRAVNGCGSSAYKFFQVKRLAPATPASLTSTKAKACPGDVITFTSATMPGATSYNWTAPAGASVTAGQGTNIATITFNSGFTASGVVSVTASNGCGVSVAKTKTIGLNMPLTPSVITGTRTVSQNQTAVPYSVVNVAGMTYNWTVASNFGSIATGQGNNAITVNATNIIGTGYTMSVTATNGCGTSPVRAIANLKIVAGVSALELAETPASELEKTDLVSIANVSIFPNPASDFVTLQMENIEEGTVAQITIFDLTGKQVFNMQSTSNLQTIDVSQFAKGMYVIHVNTTTENFVQKLQVK